MRTRAITAALLLTGAAGCDYLWDLDVRVRVPSDVQAGLDPYPQQVLLRHGPAGYGDGAVLRLAVLCAPADGDGVAYEGRCERDDRIELTLAVP